jgi:hypothetical protein
VSTSVPAIVALAATLLLSPAMVCAQEGPAVSPEAPLPGPGSPGPGVIDAWARAIADSTVPRWAGPRVGWAPPAERPPGEQPAARSVLRPLAVHADPGVDPRRVDRALAALERAHAWMEDGGWGAPRPDGGRGGTDGFDLYLRASPIEDAAGSFDQPSPADGEDDEVPLRAIRVAYDAPLGWGALDAVTAFAEVDARGLDEGDLDACVTSAYAQAVAAELDPAEAPAVRRAIGTFVGYQLTGSYGCAAQAIADAQATPERLLVGHAPGSGEAGALLLALVSARHDRGTGDFIRDLLQGARQWTWEGEGLRAEPDLWHALFHFLEVSRDPLPRVLERLAVARYFAGSRGGLGTHGVRAIADAPGDVPIAARADWGRMPRTLVRGEIELGSGGSAYALVDVRPAPPASRLRVWLRGEYGVEWSMVAVRLDEDGRAIGSMRAPIRREPRAYLPVELEPGTASVLIVVTNVTMERPEADAPDEAVRGFLLTVDRAAEG